jgi:hypothetical protein
MSNYKETETTGNVQRWFALRQGVLDNPFGGVPLLTLFEVERTSLDGELIRENQTGRNLSVKVQTPGVNIPFIDPETYEQILDVEGNPVPGYYFEDETFAGMVASAYIYAARLADAREMADSTATIAAQEGATQEQIDAAAAAAAKVAQILGW